MKTNPAFTGSYTENSFWYQQFDPRPIRVFRCGQQIIRCISLLKCRYLGLFPSDYVPILPNERFAIIKTQPDYKQGERWIMIGKFCHELYFADFVGGSGFLMQQYKQTIPELL